MTRRVIAAAAAVAFYAMLWAANPASAGPAREKATMKRLNNLVTELLSVQGGSQAASEFTFTNPRQGWVFFASRAQAAPGSSLRLILDAGDSADELAIHQASGAAEAMRLLSAGEHTLRVRGEGTAMLTSLIVRAIPQLVYCKFQANPHVAEQGPYDWAFLSKQVLPNCNTIVGNGSPEHRPYVEQWKREGKRWIVECPLPGLAKDTTVTADEVEAAWAGNPGMADPLLDGIIVDEFPGDGHPNFPAWTEAARRLQRDPRFTGKRFYPYCGTMYDNDQSREFVQAVVDAGGWIVWERYIPEYPTVGELRKELDRIAGVLREWRAKMPGIEQKMIVCLGYMSAPNESLDRYPTVDYKVAMDIQFHTLANDSAFDGVVGVMEYTSSYADEEVVRWAGELYRHYCIEGRTERLSQDPYLLPHLRNPDFDDGTVGWTVTPAEPDTIGTRRWDGFSLLQGRYPRTTEGNAFLWMKRSALRPNLVSQELEHLQPGRLYSVRMFSADYRDLTEGRSVQQKLALSIRLDGAELVAAKSFQGVFPNCYAHLYGPFDDKFRAWMNYHRYVFRVTSDHARITISDWSSDAEPGGPAGQELMLNFVEVQPYLEG